MSDRLAVYTTVYPGVEQYLPSWYRSVLAQTDRDFDLWIGLDSLTPKAVLQASGAEPGSINFITSQHGSPGQIRENAISLLVDEYASVVFVDSDDLLYPTRVESARKGLDDHDVVGCALRIIDETGHDMGVTFGPTIEEQFSSLLIRYNIFGLSNTAYRNDVLRRCLPLGDGCEIVDWSLVTRAWAGGASLHFDQQPQMAYRQYSTNIARVLLPFSARHVLAATERVIGHYRCVLESEFPVTGTCVDVLRPAYDRALLFHRKVNESNHTLSSYVAELNQLTPRYVWWWCVAHPDLEHIWRN